MSCKKFFIFSYFNSCYCSYHCGLIIHEHIVIIVSHLFAHSSFRLVMHGCKVFWLQFLQKTHIITLPRQLKPAVSICLILLHSIEQYSLTMIQYCQWKMKIIQFIVTCSTVGLCRRYGLKYVVRKMIEKYLYEYIFYETNSFCLIVS